jgi:hypothetical protein
LSPTIESSSHAKPLHLFAGICLILWNRLLLRLGVRRPVNGWRRGAGLVLKGEAAKFVLSAFHLDLLSDEPSSSIRTLKQVQQHLSERLATFLQAESEFHILIRHDVDEHRVIPHSGPSYTLRFEPWVNGPARFIRPDLWTGEFGMSPIADTSPVFEFVCRIDSDHFADLWLRINHVGTDGVPVQQMLSRLEKAWGVGKPLIVPSCKEFEPHTSPRFSPGRTGTVEVQTFIDFSRLLAWRKHQNEKLVETMTFSAALMWWLARHETFSGIYFGTTVEIPQGVGVVVVRPADYFDRPDGLARYVKEFNRQLELTRQRKSAGCKTLNAAAHLPAKLEKTLLHHALDQGTRAFGSVGLTILKDAKIFGAPLGDTGHVNGFIALGSVALESADGKRVGCVVVKGPREQISSYAKVMQEAIEQVSAN